MNDYKELIEDLRDDYKAWGDGRAQNFFEVTLRCKQAADAIEQLVKERDAAVADLTNVVHDMWTTCICDYCIGCVSNGFREGCKTDNGDRWEWRGVQEDNDEID